MSAKILPVLDLARVQRLVRQPVAAEALAVAGPIVESVRTGGWQAALDAGRRLGDLEPDGKVFYTREECRNVLSELPREQRLLLERTAARIAGFATAQRQSLSDLSWAVPGGRAGHTAAAVESAGCYAPGGRFPLPSSVLMTAVTARVAGVETVWVASPRPSPLTVAAAAVAGADGLLALGGAQAIALLAFGDGPLPACDVVVGPGNAYVTAAKFLVSASVGIDMLAGPSELVVVADRHADPAVVAMDLLAQAEHAPDALPVLVALDIDTARTVRAAAGRALDGLSTARTAAPAMERGFCVVAACVIG